MDLATAKQFYAASKGIVRWRICNCTCYGGMFDGREQYFQLPPTSMDKPDCQLGRCWWKVHNLMRKGIAASFITVGPNTSLTITARKSTKALIVRTLIQVNTVTIPVAFSE